MLPSQDINSRFVGLAICNMEVSFMIYTQKALCVKIINTVTARYFYVISDKCLVSGNLKDWKLHTV
jgi:hypothetical protein